MEEVGLTLENNIDYITSSYFIDSYSNHIIDSIFHCNLGNNIPEVIPSPREVPEYYWMTPQEIMDAQNAEDWLKHFIKLIVADKE